MKKREVVIFNFSECYEQQSFFQQEKIVWLDVKKLPGTNCYLDEEAGAYLREKISVLPLDGIHFLDSGNYHYLSCLWMERVQEPFALFMLDHHTDLQPPAFGGLLSCGGWLRELLEKNSYLKKVCLIGPPEKDYLEHGTEFGERIQFLSEEMLAEENSLEDFLKEMVQDLPLYISIDKDVFPKEDAPCNWDQGSLSLERFCNGLERLLEEKEQQILGIDICGEAEPSSNQELHKKNDEVNRRFLNILL